MDRDELREKIKAIIIEAREEDHHGNLLMYSDEATDSILSLPSLREALEKAEKWDALTKKYPHFCTRFDPEIDGEVKDETK